MKRTLRESLVDYDMTLLRALADVRGAVLTSNHRPTAARELASQLSTPASLAIVLADLSPGETEALTTLQAAGGWMEAPRFARHFGDVRSMGPGRMEREQPWLSPTSPAEGLWYRALIFKGFRQAEGGVAEVVYIPADLLASLPGPPAAERTASQQKQGMTMQPIAAPTHMRPTSPDVVEDLFSLLVLVRNLKVRPKSDGSLGAKDLQALNLLSVSPVPAAAVTDDERLTFILHLGLAADLLTTVETRLTLNPDTAQAWLKADPAQRLLTLQKAWKDTPAWNDLWHVPSLKPQPTGWKNDPILARRQVLGFLANCQPGEWYGLDELTRAVKASHPDFQRPDGDYTAWYIHDLSGQALMGFEHWDQVEGALLRYLVSGPLHWLGVTDLGFEEGDPHQPTAFRLAQTGLACLGLAPTPGGQPPFESQPTAPALVVHDDFTVRVSSDISLYTRFQLARFTDFLGRETNHIDYRISPSSLARAHGLGISTDQVMAFLQRVSGDPVPAKILDGLQTWHNRRGSIRLERGVVMRLDRPETLKALRRDPVVGPLLGEELGPGAVLVPRKNVDQVRRWLMERGYLDG